MWSSAAGTPAANLHGTGVQVSPQNRIIATDFSLSWDRVFGTDLFIIFAATLVGMCAMLAILLVFRHCLKKREVEALFARAPSSSRS